MSESSRPTGIAAQHAVFPRTALKVAPTDGNTKLNTIRIPLIPVACWRLNDPAFAFDSSFVSPNFKGEIVPARDPDADPNVPATPPSMPSHAGEGSPLTALSTIVSANQGCPVALFGHCDPAGSDSLNKTLGDRRAIAIYALVTRQPDLWAHLYDNPEVGDKWDLHMIQTMLASVEDASGTPYYAGAADGIRGPQTTDAVKRFQVDAGLPADGDPGSKTRKALYGAYMDWLCTPPDSSPKPDPKATTQDGAKASKSPFRLQPSDFLGGAGAQPGDLPNMSLQSCGKFNPIVLLKSSEMNQADTTSRNEDDAPNRRVIMFFFEKGTTVDSALWPCPKVKEANDVCKAQFWPDGDSRRKNGDTVRIYGETRDTMACRFYDRFARRSPCERIGPLMITTWAGDGEVVDLRIERYDGTLDRIVKCSDADRSGPRLTFRLLPSTLPKPCRLWFQRGSSLEFYGDPFDAEAMLDDLRKPDVASAAAKLDGDE
jgi:hypothetical protein